ncbi:hypothetical protein [Leptospira alexanderi]|uniref:hypothetical protein n=1 Tax=Leptospira alexanderi TaxID=100053 RepID=UPI0009913D38|nr:hypothetical protein [Leptospira alexanderi]
MPPRFYLSDRARIALECFEIRHGYKPNYAEQVAIFCNEGFNPATIAFFMQAAHTTPRHSQEALS